MQEFKVVIFIVIASEAIWFCSVGPLYPTLSGASDTEIGRYIGSSSLPFRPAELLAITTLYARQRSLIDSLNIQEGKSLFKGK